jgi:hypothetical protein
VAASRPENSMGHGLIFRFIMSFSPNFPFAENHYSATVKLRWSLIKWKQRDV